MIGGDNKISNFQIAVLLINTIVGVGVLNLPSLLAGEVGTTGWIVLLLAGAIAALLVLMMTKLMSSYEGKDIVNVSSSLIGKIATYISIILVITYMIAQGAFIVRVFGEVIKMFLLFSTPIEVIILTMLLTAVYTVRSGIDAIARFSILVIPFIVIPLLIIGTVLLQDLDYSNILPVFNMGPIEIIKSLPPALFSFGGIESILIYLYYSQKPKEAAKYSVLAVGVIVVIYLIAFLITLSRFGEKDLEAQLWPLLSLSKTVQFPNAFIENVEGIIMSIWVLIAFTTLISVIYTATFLVSKLFKSEKNRYFVGPVLPIIYILSLIPRNVVQVYDYTGVLTNYLGTFVTIVYPILLFIVSILKKKGEAKRNEKTT